MFIIIRRKHVLTAVSMIVLAVMTVVCSSRLFWRGEAATNSSCVNWGLGLFRRGKTANRKCVCGVFETI